jgi:hypothetical protein
MLYDYSYCRVRNGKIALLVHKNACFDRSAFMSSHESKQCWNP